MTGYLITGAALADGSRGDFYVADGRLADAAAVVLLGVEPLLGLHEVGVDLLGHPRAQRRRGHGGDP